MPAWGTTTWAFEGTERSFQEGADLAEALQCGGSAESVPVRGHGLFIVHIGSIKAYCIRQQKNAARRINFGAKQEKPLSGGKNRGKTPETANYSTRRIA
jgi:hypothetical protein